MTCGRGGTGRRAALRSLWPKGRGSSSLLDRTRKSVNARSVSGRPTRFMLDLLEIRTLARLAWAGRRDTDRPPRMDRSQTDNRLIGAHLELDPEVDGDLCGTRRTGADPQAVGPVGNALEQE